MASEVSSALDASVSTHPGPWEPETTHVNSRSPELNDTSTPSNGHLTPSTTSTSPPPSPYIDPARAPAPLALRAHLLGLTLGLSVLTTFRLAQQRNPLWRLPFFLCTLSLFHSLEYYITALYNPAAATPSAFLLNNGRAYTVAHLCAFTEAFLHWAYLPEIHLYILPEPLHAPWLLLGFVFLLVGQAVRTAAMAHAGSNFNHLVQSRKRVGHVLVTDGVYAYLRHPSYFGFFWWGLGTQVVLGNWVCLAGYTVVLWRFFARRIE
ncbi:MAG: hypothetical protein Q9163_005942, partial [Psora crenata]